MARASDLAPTVADALNISAAATASKVPLHQSRLAPFVAEVRAAFAKELTARAGDGTGGAAGRSLTTKMFAENVAASSDKREWDTAFVSDATRRRMSNLPDVSLFAPWTPDAADAAKCSWFVRNNYRVPGDPVGEWTPFQLEADVVAQVEAMSPRAAREEDCVVIDRNTKRFVIIRPAAAVDAPAPPEAAFATLCRRQLDESFEPYAGSGVQWMWRDGYEVQGRRVGPGDWTAYPSPSDAMRACLEAGGDALVRRRGTNTFKMLKLDPAGREGATRVNSNLAAYLAISDTIDPFRAFETDTFRPVNVIRGSAFVEGALRAVHTLRSPPFSPAEMYKSSGAEDKVWATTDAVLASPAGAAQVSGGGAVLYFLRGRQNDMRNLIFTLNFTRKEILDARLVRDRVQAAFQRHGVERVYLYDYSTYYRNFAMYNRSSTDYSFGWNTTALDYLGMEGSWQMRRMNPRKTASPAYHMTLRRRQWQWSWWNATWVGVSRGWTTGRYGNYRWYGRYRNKRYRYASNYKWDRLSFGEINRPRDLAEALNRAFPGLLKATVVREEYVDEAPPRGFPSGYAGKNKYRRRWKGAVRIENVTRREVGVYMYAGWKLTDRSRRSGPDLGTWRWYWGSNRWNSHPAALVAPGRSVTVDNLDIAEYDGPDDYIVTDFRIPDLAEWAAAAGIPAAEVAARRPELEELLLGALRELHTRVGDPARSAVPDLRVEGFRASPPPGEGDTSVDAALGWSPQYTSENGGEETVERNAIAAGFGKYLDYRFSVDSVEERDRWGAWIRADADLSSRVVNARWSAAATNVLLAYTVLYALYTASRFRYRKYVFGALAIAVFLQQLTRTYRIVHTNSMHTHWDQPGDALLHASEDADMRAADTPLSAP